jgi:AcrR family transcriptional regulator
MTAFAGVSVDAVAAKAGVTKRTLYYHFKSKDDLVAAYLAARDQPNLALFRQWFAEADDGLPAQVRAHLSQSCPRGTASEMEGLRLPAHFSGNSPTCPAIPP